MRYVAITQRVDIVASYNERRDALDQNWTHFLGACGLTPIALPNTPEQAVDISEKTAVAGVILSGGNDLVALGGDAPERDETEIQLMNWARSKTLPIVGVCRGMQLIQHVHGVTLEEVDGHVGKKHVVDFEQQERSVNSFHRYGATMSTSELTVTARAPDGVIEAIKHVSENILGIMWHPEREQPFDKKDIEFFGSVFSGTS